MVETRKVRNLYQDAYVVFGAAETYRASFSMLTGKSLEIPLTLKNIPLTEAKIILYTSNPSLADYRIEGTTVIIDAKKPGKLSLSVFVRDKLLTNIEEDDPLDISIQIF